MKNFQKFVFLICLFITCNSSIAKADQNSFEEKVTNLLLALSSDYNQKHPFTNPELQAAWSKAQEGHKLSKAEAIETLNLFAELIEKSSIDEGKQTINIAKINKDSSQKDLDKILNIIINDFIESNSHYEGKATYTEKFYKINKSVYKKDDLVNGWKILEASKGYGLNRSEELVAGDHQERLIVKYSNIIKPQYEEPGVMEQSPFILFFSDNDAKKLPPFYNTTSNWGAKSTKEITSKKLNDIAAGSYGTMEVVVSKFRIFGCCFEADGGMQYDVYIDDIISVNEKGRVATADPFATYSGKPKDSLDEQLVNLYKTLEEMEDKPEIKILPAINNLLGTNYSSYGEFQPYFGYNNEGYSENFKSIRTAVKKVNSENKSDPVRDIVEKACKAIGNNEALIFYDRKTKDVLEYKKHKPEEKKFLQDAPFVVNKS